ncbi:MAG: hypothetical protein ACOZBW_08760 [Thermodesulfobacteriota bacterium]
MAKQIPGCLSKSLSGSKSNCIYGGTLKEYFHYPDYPCTFLGGKKSTKRTGPCSLAFGFPCANAFFGAGRNSPACGGLKQPARFFPKKAFAQGCAAMGGTCH